MISSSLDSQYPESCLAHGRSSKCISWLNIGYISSSQHPLLQTRVSGLKRQQRVPRPSADADSPSSAGLQSRPCWRCLLLSVGWHCGTLHAGGPVHLCSISASFPIRLLQPEHILSLLTIRSSMLVLPAAVLARRPLSSSNADKSAGQDAAEPGAWSA